MGENELVKAILNGTSLDPRLIVPNGDDGVVLQSHYPTTLSVDAHIENVHFRREWSSLHDIGSRAVMAAMSDLLAMRAHPCGALVSLSLPNINEGVEIMNGVKHALKECGALLLGGNISKGSELQIHTTVCGEQRLPPLTRSGATPGEGIYVTGPLGLAHEGLRLLTAGLPPSTAHEQNCLEHFLRPKIDFSKIILLDTATAGLDVSDGLLLDLSRLCRASGVGAELRLDASLLHGGDDYEVVFTSPTDVKGAMRIGTVTQEKTLCAFDALGKSFDLTRISHGYEHDAE